MVQKTANMKIKQKTAFFILLIIAYMGSAQQCVFQQKVNIKTLFWMLPADALPEYIDISDRDALEELILVRDLQNGYLEIGGAQFTWEMCYWNLKDGRKLVAVNKNTVYGSVIRTFFYEKGKLKEKSDYKLGGEQTYILEDFVDVSQLDSDVLTKAREAFSRGDYNLYFGLPQEGTSLKVWLDEYSLMEQYDAIPYEAQKQVVLKWENEKWVKQD